MVIDKNNTPVSCNRDERNLAVAVHLMPLVAFFAPGINVVIPLLVWWFKRGRSVYVEHHARESLNFQISFVLLMLAWIALKVMVIGLFLLPLVPFVLLVTLVLMVRAAIKAARGEYYLYPLSVWFIQ